ncbi:MAG TPA: hypothetical protein VGD99_15345 [Anaerolineae bacterium]|jgi:hypothetical protein
MSHQDLSSNSPNNKVDILQRTIEQLHINRLIYEEKAALYGPLDTPVHILNAKERIAEELAETETQLAELQSGQGGQSFQNIELKRFWQPFLREGTKFFVPHNLPEGAASTRVQVSALNMQGVFNMSRLLIRQFTDLFEDGQIRLEVGGVLKQDHTLERITASSQPHLIVPGAPGANPLSNYLLSQFKGISPEDEASLVRQGYIFRAAGDYLGSPFIVSDEGLKRYSSQEQAAMQSPGIYDLIPGQPPHFFPRTFKRYDEPDPSDQDCALIVTGWTTLPGQNRIRRAIVIAGHSRHSTLAATAFVVTNEEWARQINALSYYNTETIIGLQPGPSGELTLPSILAPPREIHKQSP